jgi:hypothetical protein
MARVLVRYQREWLHAGRMAEITSGSEETHADCCSSFPAGPESSAWGTHEDFIDVICQVRELDQRIAEQLLCNGLAGRS